MISPTFMYELLKILPGVIGKVDPKKKDTAKLLDAIFKLPDMFGGALKSSSTGLKIGEGTKGVGPFADADEYIGGLTGSIADKTQQNFADWSDMRIGSPMDHWKEQANRYNSLFG